jgi:hypothetical protein
VILLAAALAAATPQVIEAFDSSEDWTAQASDGVTSSISSVPGVQGKALRLDYDFHNVSGYAYTRHLTAVTFPENYELRFRIRGTPSTNDLQLKFTDAKGENVWWYQARDFRPSAEWQTIRIRRRDLSFAWGPTTDKTLRNTAAIELVVVRGRDGGKGSVEIDQLELTPLPANPPALPAPIASDAKAIDGNRATLARFSARRPLTIDFGGFREIGGVTLHWGEDWISTYDIEASDEGRRWRLLRKAASNGGDDPIPLPGAEVRMIRIVPTGAAERAESVPLPEIEIMPIEWSATPNAVIAALAREAPRGTYPRAFTEQSYWTLVGADGAQDSGLIGEDAAIEAGTGGFSVEPFVIDNERRFTWADVTATQTLAEGYLPIPTVTWTGPGFTLETSVFADVAAPKGRLMARYRLTNTGGEARYIRLLLAARPYQVNPPAQFLSQQGGVSPIHWIAQDDTGFVLRKPWPTPEGPERHLQPRPMPDWTAMAEFDDGDAIDEWRYLYQNDPLESDDNDAASAAMTWNPQLAAGETKEVVVAIPLDGTEPPADLTFEKADYDKARAAALAYWRDRLNTVQITVPAAYRRIPDSIRTATAHILMSRAGPMLKPGTRSYNRSWIRDGAMISDGLLRLGLDRPVAEYADWYSGYLFANGKVPCCVDYRGADPVPENDSHGEFIHLITQLYRFTGDRARLEAGWPRLLAAQRYMESLRQSERKPDNPPHLYGLMPPSISHEGYSAKPQYSLWDDFWALRGYKDAAFAAAVLGKPEAVQIAAERDQFQSDLHTAIAAAAAHWKIDYIPGATSLGDLDATSTTMAFDTAGEQSWLDPRLLAGTFERYWQNFVARRDGKLAWKDYTPYEIRNVSAFVRLGWRERANELLDFFFRDQRPQGWNQWAEVVGKDPREIRFIGDMPHAWVASDYIRSALDMFAYEADDGAIVLAAGLLPDMLAGEGSGIRGLRTTQGILSYAISATPDRLTLTIEPGAMPKAGFRLPWPFHGTPGKALIDGKPARFNPAGLSIPATGKAIRVEVDRR